MPKKSVKPENAPILTDWVTASQAAEMLGVSRQSVNRFINEGRFASLHALGERPVYVLKRREVVAMSAILAEARKRP